MSHTPLRPIPEATMRSLKRLIRVSVLALPALILLTTCRGDGPRIASEEEGWQSSSSLVIDEPFEQLTTPETGDLPWETLVSKAAMERYQADGDMNPWPADDWRSVVPGDEHKCADMELKCRFAAYTAAPPTYCDAYCTALYLQCRADELKDLTLVFAGPECEDENDPETCKPVEGPTWRTATEDLLASVTHHYYAAAFLIYALEYADGPACMEYDLGGRTADGEESGFIITSSEASRYVSKIAHSIEQIEEVSLNAVERLLARADAGFGARTEENLVNEWFRDDSPRSQALQILLGGGLQLHPCTIDPELPGVAGGKELFNHPAVGRDPDPVFGPPDPPDDNPEIDNVAEALGLACDSNLSCRNAAFSLFETSLNAWRVAVASEAEVLKTTHTSGHVDFPRRRASDLQLDESGRNARGAAKPFALWLADGAAAEVDEKRFSYFGAICFNTEWASSGVYTYDACIPRAFMPFSSYTGTLGSFMGVANLVGSLSDQWRATTFDDGSARAFVDEAVARVSGEHSEFTARIVNGIRTQYVFIEPDEEPTIISDETEFDIVFEVPDFDKKLAAAGYGSDLSSPTQTGLANALLQFAPRALYTDAAAEARRESVRLACGWRGVEGGVDCAFQIKTAPECELFEVRDFSGNLPPGLPALPYAVDCARFVGDAAVCSIAETSVVFDCTVMQATFGAVDPVGILDPDDCTLEDQSDGGTMLVCVVPSLRAPGQIVSEESPLSDYAGGVGDIDEATWGLATGVFETDTEKSKRAGIWVLTIGDTLLAWFNAAQHLPRAARTRYRSIPPIPDSTKGYRWEWTTSPLAQSSDNPLLTKARSIIERHPDDCRLPRTNAFGIRPDYVPPLENEAIFDPIPYESAHNRYLDIAATAARDAAKLMEEAIEAEQDILKEEAVYRTEVENFFYDADAELEQICGPIATGLGGDPDLVRDACHVPSEPNISDVAQSGDIRRVWLESLGKHFALSVYEPGHEFPLPSFTEPSFKILGVSGPCRSSLDTTGDPAYFQGIGDLAGAEDPVTADEFSVALDEIKTSAVCSAFYSMRRVLERMEDPNLPIPVALADGHLEANLPWQGDIRETLSSIEQAQLVIGTEFSVLAEQMEQLYIELDKLEMVKAHADNNRWIQIATPILGMLGNVTNCITSVGLGGGTGCVNLMGEPNRFVQMDANLAAQDNETAIAIKNAALAASAWAQYELRAVDEVNRSIDEIRNLVWRLQSLEEAAVATASRADRAVQRARIESMWADPWKRGYLASHKRRAMASMKRAQRLGFIARRAIEFRFVVDLERMNEPMLLGDIPANWARDVFLDQFALDDPMDRFMRPTVDYVEHLNDFINFYSASFPFQNGTTTVVISAKDDLGSPYFGCCYSGVNCEDDTIMTIENTEYPPFGYPYSRNWDRRLCLDQNGEEIAAEPDPDHPTDPVPYPEVIQREYDFDGELLRGSFRRHCAGEPANVTHDLQEPCRFIGPGGYTDYYVWRFWISLASLDTAGRLGHLGLSAENYNYRIRDIALNFVGYDLLDCMQATNPASCFTITFVPYDLIQTGTVEIRNHDLVPHAFTLPRGGALGGKALAAERFITSPIATADNELLSQYWVHELTGRPLQGEYELRIYQTEAFQWHELEDIQIVVQLDYWSPFEVVPW